MRSDTCQQISWQFSRLNREHLVGMPFERMASKREMRMLSWTSAENSGTWRGAGPKLSRRCKCLPAEMQWCVDVGQRLAWSTKINKRIALQYRNWRHTTVTKEQLVWGRDGMPRVVRLQAGKNHLKRPFPLELCPDRTKRTAATMLNPHTTREMLQEQQDYDYATILMWELLLASPCSIKCF